MLKWMIPSSLLLFAVSGICEWTHAPVLWTFVLTCLAIIPLAGWMGQATEAIAVATGPRIGGLLSATFGNAVELIIGIISLGQGMQQLVKASITGSILGNLLFVLGVSFFVGGIRHPIQRFNVRAARSQASMLLLSIGIVFVLPASFSAAQPQTSLLMSKVAAGVSMILYLAGLLFSLFTHRELFASISRVKETRDDAPMRLSTGIFSLLGTTVLVAFESEWLVGGLHVVGHLLGWTDVFMGVVVIAIVGNAAEHASAVWMAWRNRMDLSLEIAVGSTLQVSMFVAPVLFAVSLFLGRSMPLLFSWPELISMGAAVLLVVVLLLDGESNWLEGALALGAYLVMSVGFYTLHTVA